MVRTPLLQCGLLMVYIAYRSNDVLKIDFWDSMEYFEKALRKRPLGKHISHVVNQREMAKTIGHDIWKFFQIASAYKACTILIEFSDITHGAIPSINALALIQSAVLINS